MLVDTHCHLYHNRLAGDLDEVLARARSAGVVIILQPAIDIPSIHEALALCERFEGLYAMAALHPTETKDATDADLAEIEAFCDDPRVVAVGESGLDYTDPSDNFDWQRKRFEVHIEAAIACDLPLIIHTRNAKKDTLEILSKNNADKVGGVMHCFTEDWDTASQAIDLGFYISISGIVTFHQAENVRKMAKKIPSDRLLIETDSPWLSPVPYRGKTNHPGRVRIVAEKLAEIRGENLSDLARTTFENANRLFKLQPGSMITN